jgi:chemotaxis protein methyltransferase CheR
MMPADGFLVLGAAETVVGLTDAFKPMAEKRGLYQLGGAASAATAPRGLATGTTGRPATPAAPAPLGSRFQVISSR